MGTFQRTVNDGQEGENEGVAGVSWHHALVYSSLYSERSPLNSAHLGKAVILEFLCRIGIPLTSKQTFMDIIWESQI